MLYDVFICHASEDKNQFVRPLAEILRANRIEVWYDEFSLKPGDSIRRKIDHGLAQSRYGIVVLSKSFFDKEWPQWELDGLVQRQNSEKKNVILPVWYGISREDVIAFSPPLADKMAIIAKDNVTDVASELLKAIKPDGSTLIIARDRVMELGFEPPVITDDWWLDAVEYSGSNDMEGTFQEAMCWGRWGFPLPSRGTSSDKRGERLAWAALQMMWEEKAENESISQITHPDEVLKFISESPGLALTCHDYPPYLAAYAPQLTIKGFGGEFENDFDCMYRRSLSKQRKEKLSHSRSGSGLTTNSEPPACDELLALRHPHFGYYKPEHIACSFIQGDLNGPPVTVYDNIDYIVWFLSDASAWLPPKLHSFLLEGLKRWTVWAWYESATQCSPDFIPNKCTGKLFTALFTARELSRFKLTKDCLYDIRTRFDYSVQLLQLPETADELTSRFIDSGFISTWISTKLQRAKNKSKK